MKKKIGLLFLTFFVLTVIFLAGCGEPETPAAKPEIKISIDPANQSIEKGGQHDFTVTVTSSDKKPGSVTWSLDGNSSPNTKLEDTENQYKKTLKISSEEKAQYLFITVKSKRNSKASAYANITVVEKGTPIINKVTISPKTIELERGGNKQFSVDIEVSNDAPKDVTWSLLDNESEDTVISDDGYLVVGDDETAESFAVKVTSDHDNSKYDTASVTIKAPPPKVELSIKTPVSDMTGQGGAIHLEANVTLLEAGVSDEISWTVSGNSDAATTIPKDGKHAANLTIGANETAKTLTVRAVSNAEAAVFDTIEITILQDVWIVGLSNAGDGWGLPGIKMTQPAVKDGTFTFKAEIDKESFFRFNINGTTSFDNGKWIAPNDNIDVELGNNELHYFEGNAEKAWKLPYTGIYFITLDPAKWSMDVEKEGVEKLTSPSKPDFNNQGLASWTALSPETDVTAYDVELLKDGYEIGGHIRERISKGSAYQKNFIEDMRRQGAGNYTVIVTAIGNNITSSNSDHSVPSDPQTIVQRPAVTSVDWSGDKAAWSAGTGDSTGLEYLIKLYKNGNLINKEFKTTNLQYDFEATINEEGNGNYTFTITALGNNTLVLEAAPSALSSANTKFFDVWLVGIPDWTFPTGTKMTQETNSTFTWEGDIASDSKFRFSLTNTSGWDHIWNGNWYAPDIAWGSDTPVTFGNNIAMKYFATNTGFGADSSNDTTWTIPAGYYKFIVNPETETLRVEKPEIVDSLTVTAPNSIKRGTTTAIGLIHVNIVGKNIPVSPAVAWSITSSGHTTGTGINSATGVLTIAETESKDSITIRAAYKTKSDDQEIQISNSEPLATPGKPSLSNAGIAEWSYAGNTNVENYSLKLYNGEAQQGSSVTVPKGTYTFNFLTDTYMRSAAGVYSFTVTAIGNGTTFANSDDSPKSDTVEVFKLDAPQYTWWTGDSVNWNHQDGYDNTDSYSVRLYKDDTALGAGPVAVAKNTGTAGGFGGFDFSNNFASLITAEGDYTAKITAVGTGLYINSEEKESEVEIEKPAAPTGLWWDGNIAKWGAVTNASSYTVQLYKDDAESGSPQTATANQYDFTSSLTNTGIYKFTVTANRGNTVPSVPSEYSHDKAPLNLSISTGAGTTFGLNKINGIAYGNGVRVAVGASNRIIRSVNGGSWTTPATNPATSMEFFSVAYGGTPTQRFVAVGTNGRIFTSTDGDVWAQIASPDTPLWDNASLTLRSVIWTGSYFVAAGYINTGYYGLAGAQVVRSADGLTWQKKFNQSANPDSILALANNGNYVISVGDNGRVTYAPNVTDDWTENPDSGVWNNDKWGWMTNNIFGSDITAFDAVYGNGTWVIVGAQGKLAWSKTPNPTGNDWTIVSGDYNKFGTRNINSVAFGNGMFVAVGDNGHISVSIDGAIWTAIPPGIGAGQTQFDDREGINTVRFDGTKFIFGGQNYDTNASKIVISE